MSKTKISVILLALAALLALAGCGVNRTLGAILPSVVPAATSAATSQVNPTGGDAHFVLLDDYLISTEALAGNTYVYANIGKMKTAATGSNSQAKFLRTMDNQTVWTSHYAKTRIALPADLIPGREVYFPDRTDSHGNQRAPQNSAEANGSYWLKAKITDVTQVYQGLVTVSGGYQVNVNALRVALP